ncbi:hypothetical protein MMC30_003574 [Trapelia coarctata]|nr:hypothetical protein [Trapelia coarctata]
MGHCIYDDAACYYVHHYTGNLGPRKPDKTLSCWQWIVYGGCWGGEHRCQYAHFNTGGISPWWTYNRDTSYALIGLRGDGDGRSPATESSTGLSSSGGSMDGAEVSPVENQKQLTAEKREHGAKGAKSIWHPVEGHQRESDPLSDSSLDPSTAVISSQGSSSEMDQVDDDGSDSGESSDYFETMAAGLPSVWHAAELKGSSAGCGLLVSGEGAREGLGDGIPSLRALSSEVLGAVGGRGTGGKLVLVIRAVANILLSCVLS